MVSLTNPPPPGAMTTSDGKISAAAYNWFQNLKQSLAGAISSIGTVQGQSESGTFSISFPTNRSYRVQLNATFGYTIQSITSLCDSGSCTATWNINGTSLTGSANNVGTTSQTRTYTGNNIVAAGDNLNCVISASSGCKYAIFEIAFTRN